MIGPEPLPVSPGLQARVADVLGKPVAGDRDPAALRAELTELALQDDQTVSDAEMTLIRQTLDTLAPSRHSGDFDPVDAASVTATETSALQGVLVWWTAQRSGLEARLRPLLDRAVTDGDRQAFAQAGSLVGDALAQIGEIVRTSGVTLPPGVADIVSGLMQRRHTYLFTGAMPTDSYDHGLRSALSRLPPAERALFQALVDGVCQVQDLLRMGGGSVFSGPDALQQARRQAVRAAETAPGICHVVLDLGWEQGRHRGYTLTSRPMASWDSLRANLDAGSRLAFLAGEREGRVLAFERATTRVRGGDGQDLFSPQVPVDPGLADLGHLQAVVAREVGEVAKAVLTQRLADGASRLEVLSQSRERMVATLLGAVTQMPLGEAKVWIADMFDLPESQAAQLVWFADQLRRDLEAVADGGIRRDRLAAFMANRLVDAAMAGAGRARDTVTARSADVRAMNPASAAFFLLRQYPDIRAGVYARCRFQMPPSAGVPPWSGRELAERSASGGFTSNAEMLFAHHLARAETSHTGVQVVTRLAPLALGLLVSVMSGGGAAGLVSGLLEGAVEGTIDTVSARADVAAAKQDLRGGLGDLDRVNAARRQVDWAIKGTALRLVATGVIRHSLAVPPQQLSTVGKAWWLRGGEAVHGGVSALAEPSHHSETAAPMPFLVGVGAMAGALGVHGRIVDDVAKAILSAGGALYRMQTPVSESPVGPDPAAAAGLP